MNEHAEVGDSVWWPAASDDAWTVDSIVIGMDGSRWLAISRGDTESDIVTRVVPESECRSNAFTLAGEAE
jgi:hypothetical protein